LKTADMARMLGFGVDLIEKYPVHPSWWNIQSWKWGSDPTQNQLQNCTERYVCFLPGALLMLSCCSWPFHSVVLSCSKRGPVPLLLQPQSVSSLSLL
jgi:hypothetical protein